MAQTETESITSTSKTGTSSYEVLRNPNFTWYLTGTTLTNAATWIQSVAISWLVYDITSSGTIMGTVNLLRSVSTIGLAAVAGIAIDRFPRKKLLFGTSIYLAVISFIFGLVLIANPGVVWPLLLFSFLGGIGQAMSMPLRQTVVFDLVSRENSSSAVSLVQTGWALMRSLGPAVGGFLLLWFGPAGNFFVQAIAYTMVTLTILKLTLKHTQPVETAPRSQGDIKMGLQFILTHRSTLVQVLMSFVLPLFIIPNFNALPPIFAKDVFAGGPDTLGKLMSAVGVGGIFGGFLSTALGKTERRGLLQIAALFMLALAFAAFGLTSSYIIALIAFAFAGLFEMIFITTNQTMLQLSIPDEIRGRVTGITSLRSGLMPVGAFIAGIGSDLVGPRTMTLIFAGLCAIIAVLVYAAVPIVREYRLSDAIDE